MNKCLLCPRYLTGECHGENKRFEKKAKKMVEESEIFKDLLIDEKDVIQDQEKLVARAKEIFLIEKPTGKIMFKNFGNLNHQQRIAVILVGKNFAKKAGLNVNDSLSISEIAKELGLPMTTLSVPLKKELVSKGFVEQLTDRKYRVAYHRIPELFEKIFKLK